MKQPRLKDIRFDPKGTKELRELVSKSKKIKITVNIDEDILTELRKIGNAQGIPYQSLLNRLLREAVESKRGEESRLDRLEKELMKLKRKITA